MARVGVVQFFEDRTSNLMRREPSGVRENVENLFLSRVASISVAILQSVCSRLTSPAQHQSPEN
jgi:hypothetical protein